MSRSSRPLTDLAHGAPADSDRAPPQAAIPPSIASDSLFAGRQSVEIEHAGQRYLLRITRENKLILTK